MKLKEYKAPKMQDPEFARDYAEIQPEIDACKIIYPFYTYTDEADGHAYWVAKSHVLKGCIGQGETEIDALRELADNEAAWLETAEEFGIPIPKVSKRYCNF